MNIIRVKLPDGVKRFKPLTVSDYRDLLLIRNEMKSNPEERQEILDQMLEELYPEYAKFEREYIFLCVLIASIGKSKIPLSFECPSCHKDVKFLLDIHQQPLTKPELKINNITFKFRLPTEHAEPDVLFRETIDEVSDGESTYKWKDIPEYHSTLIDMISFNDFEQLTKQFSPIKVDRTVTCCKQHVIKYNRLLELFELLVDPNEIFTFYRINRVLAKHQYQLADVMNMFPVERSIALTLIEKEMKEK